MITLDDMMKELLSNACPWDISESDSAVRIFKIETHCIEYTITARLLAWSEVAALGDWEILSYTTQSI